MEDGGGVHASAEPDSEAHVGHKVLANRIVQEIIELGFCIFERLRHGRYIWNTPVRVLVRAAVLPFQPVAGWQLFNSIHQGPRTWNVVHGQITVQSLEAEPAFDLGMDENPLQFRSKENILASLGDIKRLNANAVACQH